MKALVYSSPETVVYRDEPEPVLQPGDSLVRVEAVGICGSDLHAFRGHDDRRPAPLILGHEAMGIAQGGAYEGRRVVINPLVTCGMCPVCRSGRSNICVKRQIVSIAPRQGAFAEFLAIPERNMVEVPDGLSAAQAALTEPVATGWHAVAVAARVSWTALDACRVMVIGGGAIGMAVALSLRARGCADIHVAETNPLRRDTVARADIGKVLDPVSGAAIEDDFADVVIDCVGGGLTRALASAAVRPGGAIIHVGLQNSDEGLDVRKMTLHEIAFVGTYTYTMADFRETVVAMAEGRLGPLDWFEERSLADGHRAFEDLVGGRTAAAKIILKPELPS